MSLLLLWLLLHLLCLLRLLSLLLVKERRRLWRTRVLEMSKRRGRLSRRLLQLSLWQKRGRRRRKRHSRAHFDTIKRIRCLCLLLLRLRLAKGTKRILRFVYRRRSKRHGILLLGLTKSTLCSLSETSKGTLLWLLGLTKRTRLLLRRVTKNATPKHVLLCLWLAKR